MRPRPTVYIVLKRVTNKEGRIIFEEIIGVYDDLKYVLWKQWRNEGWTSESSIQTVWVRFVKEGSEHGLSFFSQLLHGLL